MPGIAVSASRSRVSRTVPQSLAPAGKGGAAYRADADEGNEEDTLTPRMVGTVTWTSWGSR